MRIAQDKTLKLFLGDKYVSLGCEKLYFKMSRSFWKLSSITLTATSCGRKKWDICGSEIKTDGF